MEIFDYRYFNTNLIIFLPNQNTVFILLNSLTKENVNFYFKESLRKENINFYFEMSNIEINLSK
jgi:hypothetical protein